MYIFVYLFLTDNDSGTDAGGQHTGGYCGPTTATIESTSLPSDPRTSYARSHHVTVREPSGGDQTDCLIGDVTDNDVNSRRVESLRVSLALPYLTFSHPRLGHTSAYIHTLKTYIARLYKNVQGR